ncbi:MAG: hypothetical protein U0271_02050 [Polyangiaceae bacterium]
MYDVVAPAMNALFQGERRALHVGSVAAALVALTTASAARADTPSGETTQSQPRPGEGANSAPKTTDEKKDEPASESKKPSGATETLKETKQEAKRSRTRADRTYELDAPSPLEVDYAQYGVALAGDFPVDAGGICPNGESDAPCIIGPGGGPVLRGGYRPSGPWYVGGAYQFAKLDSNNLYRLPILQMLRVEGRFFVDFGSRFTPYVMWSVGGIIYGNEFSASTGGVMTSVGGGIEFEITRFLVVGLNFEYEPMLFIGFEDSAGQARDTGLAQFLHAELVIELRSELGRE